MKFSTDELMPFFEVRTGMSKHLDDVQAGKEIVITRHGKPEGALLSAARLFQYREHERVIGDLLTLLKSATPQPKLTTAQIAVVREAEQLLVKPMERA
jgi:prevent-host-death family protein